MSGESDQGPDRNFEIRQQIQRYHGFRLQTALSKGVPAVASMNWKSSSPLNISGSEAIEVL